MQHLFQPGSIGKLEIRNRIVMAPMATTGLFELDGRYSQRGIDYYVERAKGGVGLIITGTIAADVEIEKRAWGPWTVLPRADSYIYIPRLNELTDAVHDFGAKIAAQLTVGWGRNAKGFIIQSGWAIAPSPQPCFWNPNIMARGLTVDEIKRLVRAFGEAAGFIKMAGFDAIEIHGHEGYLLDEFMTSKWNKRTDEYGGDLEGHLRFPLQVIEATIKAVGPDFPIIYRMAARHHIEEGRDIEESIVIVKRLEEAGISCLHIDAGCYEAWKWSHPLIYMERGCNVEDAAAIKKAVGIPVITVGRLGYPELAERVIAEGKADFIALGRPLLADPEWPNKVKTRRFEDIRPCIGDFDGCLGRIFYEGRSLSCSVNPQSGMEREFTIKPAPQKKSILVIGGGPGGMEASRVAALRGHQVTLWEKNAQLGGNLVPGSVPNFKSDTKDLIRYLSSQLKKLGVQIELNKEASPELVKEANPDEVIIATGATPLIPDIRGNDKKQMITAIDVLLGKKETGKRVVIIGGGIVGCETALWLARQGKKVSIVELQDDVMMDIFPDNKKQILKMLAEAGATMMKGVKILEVNAKAVIIESQERKGRFLRRTQWWRQLV
jgi:2-enoate reductase